MKKIISNLASKPIVKAILKAGDSALLGGLVHNVKEATTDSPKGKLDVPKIIGASIPIVLLVLLATKVITMDQLIQLFDLFE